MLRFECNVAKVQKALENGTTVAKLPEFHFGIAT